MGKIIAINAGSSTLKFKLFKMPEEKVLGEGLIERIGLPESHVEIKYDDGKKFEETLDVKDHEQAIQILLDQLLDLDIINDYNEITGVGHRVVAGGEYFDQSVIITPEVLKKIESLDELAPLHEPANVLGIKAFEKVLPNVTSVAVFDTSFHQTIPEKNYLYSLPYEYYEKYRARKYGFHGISYRYVSQRAAKLLGKPVEDLKMIIMHLGAGASICAVKNGKSYDTSMGFTPVTGLTMATRSGDVDPSLLAYVMEKEGMTDINDMIKVLNTKSGLLGISGVSADMREVEEAQKTNHRAKIARQIYDNRIVRYIGSYLAELGGADAIVFTAGVGENSITVRQEVTDQLSYFGIGVDKEKNNVRGVVRDLSAKGSKIKTLLVPTNEELMIALDVQRLEKESKEKANK
ncbi:acetate/propionate family kinase [Fructilactobacillus fructivorans]|uniref:Acetate kinase n=1 Tax=Fructilactobacillus fructivorans TaxID=1614 RepID=A0AAE6P0Z8_9LACO|nr:acetate kinase [Fructilactobacillus fructivorans]KRK57885.1 acetate kinase [Fructilactobacillus fructivorans]KRN12572.1 acetate kinase [Fructilactobacillus fructivorans]KRN40762.1 acetate kinase [Fructilactobacillus fructivorans]KRN42441.1 acetate kinase [Fructilactobacillus fructivorans]MCT0151181.1 acetate kinase [Fructilactobacillus fructivorans]